MILEKIDEVKRPYDRRKDSPCDCPPLGWVVVQFNEHEAKCLFCDVVFQWDAEHERWIR
jgi:hypothetical protein